MPISAIMGLLAGVVLIMVGAWNATNATCPMPVTIGTVMKLAGC